MKTKKIQLNEISGSELNEREMCRILGGGEVGCCQCGCKYANNGGSSTSANSGANNAGGLTSDGSQPCCKADIPTVTEWDYSVIRDKQIVPVDNLCTPPPIIP